MSYYKEQEQLVTKENQQMTSELSELRLQLQKISYESKENAITVDSLKEANQDLMAELEELKKNLAEMRLANKEASDGEKEKKKAEKMAQMMSGFDPSVCIQTCIKKYHLFSKFETFDRDNLRRKNDKFGMLCKNWMVEMLVT